jgi:hypothetical protein
MNDYDQAAQTLRAELIAFSQFTTRSLDERNIDLLMLDACLRARAGMAIIKYVRDRDRLCGQASAGKTDKSINKTCPSLSIRLSGTCLLAQQPGPQR